MSVTSINMAKGSKKVPELIGNLRIIKRPRKMSIETRKFNKLANTEASGIASLLKYVFLISSRLFTSDEVPEESDVAKKVQGSIPESKKA